MDHKNSNVDYTKSSRSIRASQEEVKTNTRKTVEEKPKYSVLVYGTVKLNVRAKPSLNANVSHIINREDRLLVEYVNDEWAKVLTKSKEGFAMRAFLKEV